MKFSEEKSKPSFIELLGQEGFPKHVDTSLTIASKPLSTLHCINR